MVRWGPVLFGVFAIVMLYIFPISVNNYPALSIPLILRDCSIGMSSLIGIDKTACDVYSAIFYLIWFFSIGFVTIGIFSSPEEDQSYSSVKCEDLRRDVSGNPFLITFAKDYFDFKIKIEGFSYKGFYRLKDKWESRIQKISERLEDFFFER